MQPMYQHSKVFASMKDVTEKIQDNLTTSQYLQILDEMLERALIPVLCSTNYFESAVARLLGWQEKNFRRKISFLERGVVAPLAITFLLQGSKDRKVEALRDLKLERGVKITLLNSFLNMMNEYVQACDCTLVNPASGEVDISYCLNFKKQVEKHLDADGTLLAAINETKFWLQKSLEFKQSIMEKYIRLTLKNAQKDYVTCFNMSVKLDDIIQTYLLAASRAIDKCDSSQGALTSHIQNWFLTARSRVFESMQAGRVDLSIDAIDFQSDEFRSMVHSEPNLEAKIVNAERVNLISRLARIADPVGAARLLLGIEEWLTEDERSKVGVGKQRISDNFA